MRFKVDENLPTEVVEHLRSARHDAMSVLDQNLGGATDGRIGEVCRTERRIILTLDTDFGNLRAFPPSQFHGILVLRLRSQDKNHVLAVMRSLVAVLEVEDPDGQLWIVEEDRIRIRS